jgi:hypothetical protein
MANTRGNWPAQDRIGRRIEFPFPCGTVTRDALFERACLRYLRVGPSLTAAVLASVCITARSAVSASPQRRGTTVLSHPHFVPHALRQCHRSRYPHPRLLVCAKASIPALAQRRWPLARPPALIGWEHSRFYRSSHTAARTHFRNEPSESMP